MYRLMVVLGLVFLTSPLFCQEKPPMVDFDRARSQMVLRSNTRDKMHMVKDNMHRKQLSMRRQVIMGRQQQLMQKKMHHIQRRRIHKQRRAIQQRNLRQRAIRRHQMQRR